MRPLGRTLRRPASCSGRAPGSGVPRRPALPHPGLRPETGPETESEAELLIETFRLDGSGELFDAPATRDIGAWLPAGSHAEAVVLAGVDASAGVSSQGDPRPVLLRIVSPAWTAADGGTALAVDIDGCTVTGAAHGDLSSEKVYARLRTLTCAGDEPDTVLETEVAGFVAGAGKTGVRGPVVSREGALIEKAFLAGMVSGLGEGVSGAFCAAGRRQRHGHCCFGHECRQHRARRYRQGRARLRGCVCGPQGRRLPDPPRRTVPAGDPAPGRDPGDGGVHRGRLARRQDRKGEEE